MVDEGQVARVALALPGAYEQESYGGQPSWRTKPRMFAWIRDDPEALVVWVSSPEEKLAMIDTDPKTFFTIDHYDGHPIVLVRLEEVEFDEMADLVQESWRQRAPKRLVATWDREHAD